MARSTKKDEGQRRATRSSESEDASGRSRADRAEDADKSGDRKRSRLEGMVPDIIKKAMVSGIGAIFMTEETIRSALSDMPKDAVNFFVNQADQTKEQLLNLIAKEYREFLQSADLSEELSKVLARLTLDIHTRIRFVSTDEAGEGLSVSPDLSYDVQVSERGKKKRR